MNYWYLLSIYLSESQILNMGEILWVFDSFIYFFSISYMPIMLYDFGIKNIIDGIFLNE